MRRPVQRKARCVPPDPATAPPGPKVGPSDAFHPLFRSSRSNNWTLRRVSPPFSLLPVQPLDPPAHPTTFNSLPTNPPGPQFRLKWSRWVPQTPTWTTKPPKPVLVRSNILHLPTPTCLPSPSRAHPGGQVAVTTPHQDRKPA